MRAEAADQIVSGQASADVVPGWIAGVERGEAQQDEDTCGQEHESRHLIEARGCGGFKKRHPAGGRKISGAALSMTEIWAAWKFGLARVSRRARRGRRGSRVRRGRRDETAFMPPCPLP